MKPCTTIRKYIILIDSFETRLGDDPACNGDRVRMLSLLARSFDCAGLMQGKYTAF